MDLTCLGVQRGNGCLQEMFPICQILGRWSSEPGNVVTYVTIGEHPWCQMTQPKWQILENVWFRSPTFFFTLRKHFIIHGNIFLDRDAVASAWKFDVPWSKDCFLGIFVRLWSKKMATIIPYGHDGMTIPQNMPTKRAVKTWRMGIIFIPQWKSKHHGNVQFTH